jgi:hypothetical protein
MTNSETDALGGSGFFGTGQFLGQDNYNRKAEKTLSQLDTPHALVLSYTYELPIGKGKKFLGSVGAGANLLVGGWSIAGIQRYQSGIPVGAIACGVNTGLYGKDDWYDCLRPNLVGTQLKGFSGHFDPSVDRYLNPAAFAMPANFTGFGNAAIALPGVRTQMRNDESITLSKRTVFKERVSVIVRGEFFNLFNRAIFSVGSSDLSNSAGFGVISSTYYAPRHIQLGGKIEF